MLKRTKYATEAVCECSRSAPRRRYAASLQRGCAVLRGSTESHREIPPYSYRSPLHRGSHSGIAPLRRHQDDLREAAGNRCLHNQYSRQLVPKVIRMPPARVYRNLQIATDARVSSFPNSFDHRRLWCWWLHHAEAPTQWTPEHDRSRQRSAVRAKAAQLREIRFGVAYVENEDLPNWP